MAANTSPIFVLTPNVSAVTFVNADGTTAKTVFTPGTNGSKLFAIAATSTDSSTRNILLNLVKSSTTYQIGWIPVTNGAGNSATAAVNLLNLTNCPFLQNDGSLLLASGVTVTVAPDNAVTSGKTMYLTALGGDY